MSEVKNVERPTYALSRISQDSGSGSITLSNTGGESSTFHIPAIVLNFSKSHLAFTITAAAQTNDFVALILGGTQAPIRDFTLMTKGGRRLIDLPYSPRYLKVASCTDTSLDEFLSNTEATGFSRSNIIESGTGVGGYRFGVGTGVSSALATIRARNSIAYTEPMYYDTSGADNTALAYDFRIPLNMWKNTLAELNEDFYFPEGLDLVINWAPSNLIGRDGDDNGLTNQGNLDAVCTLTNLYMYLAVEQNKAIIDAVKNEVMGSGKSYLIDYVHHANRTITALNQSFELRFSRAQGQRLKRVYCIPYIGTVNTGTGYYNHHFDQAGDEIVSLQTSINNQPLQQWIMDTSAGDEYLVMSDKLKGSVVQTLDQFLANYFFVDSWDGLKYHERRKDEKLGLDLSQEVKYTINAVCEASTSIREWYVYAVCQRVLKVSKDGVELD